RAPASGLRGGGRGAGHHAAGRRAVDRHRFRGASPRETRALGWRPVTQLFALLLTLAVIDAALPAAQPGSGTVRVTVPGVVLIPVDDVSAATASSGPARVAFNQAFLSAGQALRISVKADTTLTLPGG